MYESREIAINYIRGWFPLDLLAAVPFDLLNVISLNTVSIYCGLALFLWKCGANHVFVARGGVMGRFLPLDVIAAVSFDLLNVVSVSTILIKFDKV